MIRLAPLLLAGCTLATDFDRSRAVEQTEALCTDDIDNDEDGLTDCQDFKCLPLAPCCDIPEVVLADRFEAACAATACADVPDEESLRCRPDDAVWQAWGAPLPLLCDEAFVPFKEEQCYDVGILGRTPFSLAPGLIVRAGLSGRPEIEGRIEVGLTLQAEVAGAIDPCGTVAGVEAAISIRMVAAVGGYQLITRFDGRDVGASPVVTDQARHEVELRVTGAGFVQYALDGAVFSVAPEPLAGAVRMVRLSLSGRGRTARVEDARVVVGSQCEAPSGWEAATQFVALDESAAIAGEWDSFSVYAPAVARDPDGNALWMFYGGCADRLGQCNVVVAGAGRATSVAGAAFAREASCPIFGASGIVCPGGVANPFGNQLNNSLEVGWVKGAPGPRAFLSRRVDGVGVALVEMGAEGWTAASPVELAPGPAGDWDAEDVCCATAVDKDGVMEMWYAGLAGDGVWRVGRAVVEGGVLVRSPAGPVLTEGVAGAFDDHGAGDPEVIWDPARGLYRIWYTASGFLGTRAIGYAVSLDGIVWHKYPEPAATADELGLAAIGAPSVLAEEGETRMWVEGEALDRLGVRIYELAIPSE